MDIVQMLVLEEQRRKEAKRKVALGARTLANKKRVQRKKIRKIRAESTAWEEQNINDDWEDVDIRNNRKSTFLAAVKSNLIII